MDTLIALGTLAALAVSSVVTIALDGRHIHIGGGGALAASLHGVMAPLIVSILATGRFIEAKAKGKAAEAMRSLLSLRPPTARPVADPTDEQGVLVRTRERSRRLLGAGSPRRRASPWTGRSWLGSRPSTNQCSTGEPLPVERGPGSIVTGGTINGAGSLVIRGRHGRFGVGASPAGETRGGRPAGQSSPPAAGRQDQQRIRAERSRRLGGDVPGLVAWSATAWAKRHSAVSPYYSSPAPAPWAAAPVAVMVGCGRASAMGMLSAAATPSSAWPKSTLPLSTRPAP